MMRTSGRIVITAPAGPFYLGEEGALALTLKGPVVRNISTEQSTAEATEHSQNIQSSYAEAKLERREDGQAYITVVPQRPGRLNIGVGAVFSDGGYDMASITVDVVARRPPVKLSGEFAMKGVNYILMDLPRRIAAGVSSSPRPTPGSRTPCQSCPDKRSSNWPCRRGPPRSTSIPGQCR